MLHRVGRLPSMALVVALPSLVACGPSLPPAEIASVSVPPPGRESAQLHTNDAEVPATTTTTDVAGATSARDELRPTRHGGGSPRQRALLSTEVQGLEALLAQADTRAPERPQLLMRLGFDYIELETRARIDSDRKLASTARSNAKKMFATLDADYPGFARHDEVLFFLANQYEEAGDETSARYTYLSLIERHPTSRYLPDAYLSVAEIFFGRANEGDGAKWHEAEMAYREVVKVPAPHNKLYGYASYKLGLVLVQEGSPSAARVAFEDAFTFAERDQTVAGPRLREAARMELDSLPATP